MSAAPRTKLSRSHGAASGNAAAGIRKEDDIQLHDEADLVNFRADAYTRFINNQDQLENVTLKPFHTANIAPPLSFPLHPQKKYAASASDDEVAQVLAKLGPEELFMGDRRLMAAKMAQLARELADAQAELQQQTPEAVFGADFTEKRKAIERLAQLQASCLGEESMAALDKAVREISAGGNYVFGLDLYRQFSVPVEQLAPGVKVASAPPLYNPRLILTFLDIENPADEFLMMDGLKELNTGLGMGGGASGDDFVFDSAMKPEIAEGRNGAGAAALNMDNLSDLFVDPNANEGMDEMDALMNFDQDNEGMMNEDAFNDEFLR